MIPTPEAVRQAVQEILARTPDMYAQLNAVRDWVNANFPDFELYLEDVWNENVEGETHFEYILRSRKTYNETGVLGYDVYNNHRDAKGVWHLDEYRHSVRLFETADGIVDFLRENGAWS